MLSMYMHEDVSEGLVDILSCIWCNMSDYSALPALHPFGAVVMLPTFKIVPDNFVERWRSHTQYTTNKKGHPEGDLLYLARHERFERPTLRFEARLIKSINQSTKSTISQKPYHLHALYIAVQILIFGNHK